MFDGLWVSIIRHLGGVVREGALIWLWLDIVAQCKISTLRVSSGFCGCAHDYGCY